jgi:hypothetical protein
MSLEKGIPPTQEQKTKKESTQRMYDGVEGIDWEWDEKGFPRRIKKEDNYQPPQIVIESPHDIIENTQNRMNELREKLGLQPTDEIPPSMRSLSEQVDDDTKYKNNQQEETAFTETETIALEKRRAEERLEYETRVNEALRQIAEGARPLLGVLTNRDRDGLTQIYTPSTFQGIAANFRALFQNKIQLNKENIQAVTSILVRTTTLLESPNASSSSTIRDMPDSLSSLAHATRILQDALQSARQKLLSQRDGSEVLTDEIQSLCSAVSKLDYAAGGLGNFAIKRRNIMSGLR